MRHTQRCSVNVLVFKGFAVGNNTLGPTQGVAGRLEEDAGLEGGIPITGTFRRGRDIPGAKPGRGREWCAQPHMNPCIAKVCKAVFLDAEEESGKDQERRAGPEGLFCSGPAVHSWVTNRPQMGGLYL